MNQCGEEASYSCDNLSEAKVVGPKGETLGKAVLYRFFMVLPFLLGMTRLQGPDTLSGPLSGLCLQ